MLFETALQRAVTEAEPLHVRFMEGSDGPRQVVEPRSDWLMPVVDVSEEPDPRTAKGRRSAEPDQTPCIGAMAVGMLTAAPPRDRSADGVAVTDDCPSLQDLSYPVFAPPYQSGHRLAPGGHHDGHVGKPAIEPLPSARDDLTRLDGIGPKISELLQQRGVTMFTQLAETDVERLRQILHEANLRMADPRTWPQQAKSAAAGNRESPGVTARAGSES